jgi:hypothetical protein
MEVTLAGQTLDEASTAKSLDTTSQRLAKLDRTKLNQSDAAAYDQVNDLVSAGRQALRRHNVLVASSYALKASTLMNRLSAVR